LSELFDELSLPGARAIFSTRNGGVSGGPYRSLNLGILTDDDPQNVAENRRRLAHDARVQPERVVMGWQVHGSDLRDWDGPDPQNVYAEPGGKQLPRVDGHLTTVGGLALLFFGLRVMARGMGYARVPPRYTRPRGSAVNSRDPGGVAARAAASS
jgi:copper oxidase (laccase) domain-containing protein